MRKRKRNRLQGFDYTSNRLYFITSCVKNMQCYFGDILPIEKDALKSAAISSDQLAYEMILNPCGEIASKQWYWLEKQYPYVKSHALVVMPNHVHGILEINTELCNGQNPIKIKSLSELIGAYKTTTSKQIHLITTADGSTPYADFEWHRSFHDHIIRTETSYHRVVRYIQQNPANWARDKYNKTYLKNKFKI